MASCTTAAQGTSGKLVLSVSALAGSRFQWPRPRPCSQEEPVRAVLDALGDIANMAIPAGALEGCLAGKG